jgi:hypothetical protein
MTQRDALERETSGTITADYSLSLIERAGG